MGLVSTIIVQLCNIGYGLVLPRMVILDHGSEVNGVMAGALQIVSLISLLEAGLAGASIRQLYAPMAHRDVPAVDRLLGSIRYYYLKVAGWAAAVGLLAGIIYSLVVDTSLALLIVIFITWLVIAGPVLDFALTSKYQVYYVASQGVSKFQVAQLSALLYKFVVVVGCARFSTSVITMLFLISLAPLLKWLILFSLFKLEPFRYQISLPAIPIEQRGSVFGHQLLGAVVYSGPLLYIATFVSAAAASIFSVNNMIFGISYGFLAILMGQVVVARLGHLHANDKLTEIGSFSRKIHLVVVLGAFIVTTSSVLLLPSFLTLYLGNVGNDYHSTLHTSLFAVWSFFNITKLPAQTVINAAGKFQETLWIPLIEICVFLGVLLIGFRHASITLVLLALILSTLLRSILLTLFANKHIVRQTPGTVLSGLLSALVLVYVCFINIPFLTADSVIGWVAIAIPTVLTSAVVGIGILAFSLGISKAFYLVWRRQS